VRELARELGVTLEEVATFGDSENDLPMISAVPNSVAVANASADVARAARWHIGPAREDSVAAALEQIAAAAPAGDMPAFMR
jgi:hydroxymethylpyrimidine pyrophosphatase-like HAD family hydrolase